MDNSSQRLCLFNKYGNWVFRTQQAYFEFQDKCNHPSTVWVFSLYHDYLTCERCWRVEQERMHEAHPDLSRWASEGGKCADEVG